MDMSLPVIDGYEPRLQVFGFLNAYITVLKHAGCGVSFPVLYSRKYGLTCTAPTRTCHYELCTTHTGLFWKVTYT